MPWLSHLCRAAAVLLSFAVAACQSLPTPYQGADRGYMVASIVAPRSSTTYRRYEFYFRPVGSELADVKAFKWAKLDVLQQSVGDFETHERIGFVGVASLPPGKYEIFSFVAWNNSTPSSALSPRGGLSIPFTVKAGDVVYLGEFYSVATWGENIFGIRRPSAPYFVHSNQRERDLSIARGKDPSLPSSARNAITNAEALGTPFVRSKLQPQ
jgi:hypothetical protein